MIDLQRRDAKAPLVVMPGAELYVHHDAGHRYPEGVSRPVIGDAASTLSRLGDMSGCQTYDLKPDMITVARRGATTFCGIWAQRLTIP